MTDLTPRPTPEQLLADIEKEDRRKRRGRLKVFLGYASGVGKSFQMLDEGRRRHERGEDVVVCALQPEYPPEIADIVRNLEIIPLARTDGAEAIDVAAVLRRRPQVVLIDGLAYDNPPGNPNAHRWQDVEQLLDAGISVITSVNVQYLEKHADEIARITGKRGSVTIPRGFLDQSADEIVVVDAPSTVGIEQVYSPDQRAALLAQQQKLSRLRELALLVAAGVVDRQLETYLRSHGMEQPFGVQERILVCVTPRSNASEMLQSGRRNADRFQGEFHVVYVQQPALSDHDSSVLQQNLDYARSLGAEVAVLNGADAAQTILKYAMQRGITQIFVGHSTTPQDGWRRFQTSLVDRLIRSAEGSDVVVYPH
jgi:two-component system, OmpR family, sensor histidine kinase KdpD